MISKDEKDYFLSLLHSELVPAIGCTEPIAVALCVSKAVETLDCIPDAIRVSLSGNMLKNAMGVGIPGTGMTGLPIAIALGATIGKSAYGLEVLRDVTPEAVENGKLFLKQKKVEIKLKRHVEKLYIEVNCTAGEDCSKAIIEGSHTNFVFLSKNGQVLGVDKKNKRTETGTHHDFQGITFAKIYDFVTSFPLDDLRFILESARINMKASEFSFGERYGHELGAILQSKAGKSIFGDSTLTHILSYTAGACDARMGGAVMPVMSNSGSGNQGVATTMPVFIYARDHHSSEEDLIRALTLSHLTVIYIKQELGRLSALCGNVVTSAGAGAAITYLMGGNYSQMSDAVKNAIGSLSGVLCDGAKPSCALKMATGAYTAVMAATLAIENQGLAKTEGIVDDDVDQTIKNMSEIGVEGMAKTDEMILEIMVNKK